MSQWLGQWCQLVAELDWYSDLYPYSKVYGANMGPTWVLSAPDGPHVGSMNLDIRVAWWLWDCQWGKHHGPQLAGILSCVNEWSQIDLGTTHLHWNKGELQCSIGCGDQWEFPSIFKCHWLSRVQLHWLSICVPLGIARILWKIHSWIFPWVGSSVRCFKVDSMIHGRPGTEL